MVSYKTLGGIVQWQNASLQKKIPGFDSLCPRLRLAIARLRRAMPAKLSEGGIRFHNFIMYYVYILKCSDSKTYIGCAENLEERVERHYKGYVPATQSRLPINLISHFAFQDKYIAYNFEKYLKSGSGRAFLKKHLI